MPINHDIQARQSNSNNNDILMKLEAGEINPIELHEEILIDKRKRMPKYIWTLNKAEKYYLDIVKHCLYEKDKAKNYCDINLVLTVSFIRKYRLSAGYFYLFGADIELLRNTIIPTEYWETQQFLEDLKVQTLELYYKCTKEGVKYPKRFWSHLGALRFAIIVDYLKQNNIIRENFPNGKEMYDNGLSSGYHVLRNDGWYHRQDIIEACEAYQNRHKQPFDPTPYI